MVSSVFNPESSNIDNLLVVLKVVVSTLTIQQRQQAAAILSKEVEERMSNGKDASDARRISEYSAKLGLKL